MTSKKTLKLDSGDKPALLKAKRCPLCSEERPKMPDWRLAYWWIGHMESKHPK